MQEYLVIAIVSFIGSGLTLFSGFGLGTILVPVFTLFFPVDLAIVLTAIVHFLNNIFKLFLLGKKADQKVILYFGIPSVIAAIIGAYILSGISDIKPIAEYRLFNTLFFISPVKLVIAILMFVFALFDFIPRFKNLEIHSKYLPLGGFLSGFFGGLSGNQGALRTAFLIKTNLSKESFIATGIVLACLIDISRLTVYSHQIILQHSRLDYQLIAVATLAAFLGAFIGSRLLKKVTITIVQHIVGAMLVLFAVFLGLGII
ncbi:MAG: sulfite exporter TauE/SafE family protein [Bacteroidetes bacterium]|nr:sulfite exporter TauE/SafE family protein [Bacteroidota bacterium]